MNAKTFYIDKFCIINDKSQIDLKDFAAIKRRLSVVDQAAISAINNIFNDKIEQIIFSSKYGEFDRLDKIIEEYKGLNEVSPIKFSGSVHNYAVGCFNFTKQINIPYQALSAGDNSVSCAIVNSVISQSNSILLCYCDFYNAELKCLSCIISKEKLSENSIEYRFEKQHTTDKNYEYEDFCNLLNGTAEVFSSNLCKITRITQ